MWPARTVIIAKVIWKICGGQESANSFEQAQCCGEVDSTRLPESAVKRAESRGRARTKKTDSGTVAARGDMESGLIPAFDGTV